MGQIITKIASQYEEETDLLKASEKIQQELFSYSDTLAEWAELMAGTMLKRAARADMNVWDEVGKDLNRQAKQALKTASTGRVFYELQDAQVDLIKSLPREAAEKVHEWATEANRNGDRYESLVKRIHDELKPLTESHCRLIARTETARARTSFTEARAKAVGSDSYIWHTVGDATVRDSHAALDGTVQRWDTPPVCDHSGGKAIRAHAGQIWNCRCWAEPLFPKSIYEKD